MSQLTICLEQVSAVTSEVTKALAMKAAPIRVADKYSQYEI